MLGEYTTGSDINNKLMKFSIAGSGLNNRKLSNVKSNEAKSKAKSSGFKDIFFLTEDPNKQDGVAKSKVVITTQLPRPHSRTGGGGYSKNIIKKKLDDISSLK